jgi:hypothetical protein
VYHGGAGRARYCRSASRNSIYAAEGVVFLDMPVVEVCGYS